MATSNLGNPDANGTIAGGFGKGERSDEFFYPYAMKIDQRDGFMIIADWGNHRIVRWDPRQTQGRTIAGGNGQGSNMNQLSCPTDLLIDYQNNSLLISDRGNRRIVRWSLDAGVREGEVVLQDIDCWGLAFDDSRNLYVSDTRNHQVKQYKIGSANAKVVAGIGGHGKAQDQLDYPTYIFVRGNKDLYVADTNNLRVLNFKLDEQKVEVVARGYPRGLFVDNRGAVYLADYGNRRLVRWLANQEAKLIFPLEGGTQKEIDGVYSPWNVSQDANGQLYVLDHSSHRIHRVAMA